MSEMETSESRAPLWPLISDTARATTSAASGRPSLRGEWGELPVGALVAASTAGRLAFVASVSDGRAAFSGFAASTTS